MKRGDEVMFRFSEYDGGKHRHAKVIAVYDNNNPPACRLDIGEDGMVVRQSECESWEAYQARLDIEKTTEAKIKLEPIIRAWEAGHKTIKDIAVYLGVKHSNILSKYLEAKRRGFISSD